MIILETIQIGRDIAIAPEIEMENMMIEVGTEIDRKIEGIWIEIMIDIIEAVMMGIVMIEIEIVILIEIKVGIVI